MRVCVCVCVRVRVRVCESVWSLLCIVALSIPSRFAIILLRKRGLIALNVFLLSSGCLCFFLPVQWVSMWSVIVIPKVIGFKYR